MGRTQLAAALPGSNDLIQRVRARQRALEAADGLGQLIENFEILANPHQVH
jgi:hypothetical protein